VPQTRRPSAPPRAEDRANDFAFAANVSFVVAGVATIAGATWLAARPRHARGTNRGAGRRWRSYDSR